MTPRTQLAYVAAALTLVVGLVALLNPILAARLLGLEVIAPRGITELRSGFGALSLALAGLMLWAVPRRPKSAPLLRTLAVLIAAAALGRLASMAIDGVANVANVLLLVLQAGVAASLLSASGERPPSRAERRARADAAEARDQAASARLAAVEAERRQRSASRPSSAGEGALDAAADADAAERTSS